MHDLLVYINKLSIILAPVFYKLLFLSITGTIVGGIIFIIRKVFDKKIPPIWKYIMWAVVALSLITPFRFNSSLSLTQNISDIENVSFREEYDIIKSEEFLYNQGQNIDIEKSEQLKNEADNLFYKSLIFDVLIPLVWFAGMIFALLFLFINKLYLSYKIKLNSTKTNDFDNILNICKSKLGINSDIGIIYQDYVDSPALIGLIQPKILLPKYASNMSDESLYYVILHELGHYKRKDMVINYILLAIQSIHWFNPLVWLIFKFIREDMEIMNDSYVLEKIGTEHSKGYSKSLVEVLGLSHNISFIPKLLCMTDGKKNVERRISMIKLGESFKKHRIIVAVCCLAIICLVGGLFLSHKTNDTQKNLKVMWENRTEYVGKNSNVGNIIYSQKFPENIIVENFELGTNQPPYSIKINTKTDTETLNLYSDSLNQSKFSEISFVIFSLVENVEQITFSVDDGRTPFDLTFYRDQADDILGYNCFDRTETFDDFNTTYNDIVNKVNAHYESLNEKANGQMSSSEKAIDDLIKSITKTDEAIKFTIPESYDSPKDWNIIISGRKEFPDGMSMSEHLFEEENSEHKWEKGKEYSIALENQNFTDLSMDIYLQDETVQTIDLLNLTNNDEKNSHSNSDYKYLTFPAYKESNTENLPYIDEINNTPKFDVVMSNIPDSWEFKTSNNGEKNIPSGEFYTPVYIYENDKLIGYIGFNKFELYTDEIQPENYYQTVYTNLRMSIFFSWDPYKAVTRNDVSETGIADVWYLDQSEISNHPGAMPDVPSYETKGILSYNKDLQVYVGFAFVPDSVSEEQIQSIAETLTIKSK